MEKDLKKIKICFVITSLSTGGAQAMLYKLLEGIDRNKYDPIVISLLDKGEYGSKLQKLRIPVREIFLGQKIPNPLRLFELFKVIKRSKAEIVHTWMYHSDLIGGITAKLAGVKPIIWCIRHSELTSRDKLNTRISAKICAKLSNWLPKKIIVCSKKASKLHADLGYSQEKMVVIPNGFDLQKYYPDNSENYSVKKELNIPKDAKVVGIVGRYNHQKNHLGFVETTKVVSKSYKGKCFFVMAGKNIDWDNDELVKEIKKNNLSEQFRLLGIRKDIPSLMNIFDVYVSSSSYGEGFPNVLGEAMATGIPCVTTDVGDSGYIVGDTGGVVAPKNINGLANSIVEILNLKEQEYRRRSIEARKRISTLFEINKIINTYETQYAELIK